MKKLLAVTIAFLTLTVFAFSAQPRYDYWHDDDLTVLGRGGIFTSPEIQPEGDYIGVSVKVPYGTSVEVEIRNSYFGRVLKRYMTNPKDGDWQQVVYDNPPPYVDVRIKNDNDNPVTIGLAIFD